MEKKLRAIIVVILLCISSMVIINEEFSAKADDQDPIEGVGLDYDFMWNVTLYLSNIIHNYPEYMIPKGRAFGSWGCEFAARNDIYDKMMNIGLKNVEKVKLGHINNLDRRYTSKIEIVDYQLNLA